MKVLAHDFSDYALIPIGTDLSKTCWGEAWHEADVQKVRSDIDLNRLANRSLRFERRRYVTRTIAHLKEHNGRIIGIAHISGQQWMVECVDRYGNQSFPQWRVVGTADNCYLFDSATEQTGDSIS